MQIIIIIECRTNFPLHNRNLWFSCSFPSRHHHRPVITSAFHSHSASATLYSKDGFQSSPLRVTSETASRIMCHRHLDVPRSSHFSRLGRATKSVCQRSPDLRPAADNSPSAVVAQNPADYTSVSFPRDRRARRQPLPERGQTASTTSVALSVVRISFRLPPLAARQLPSTFPIAACYHEPQVCQL